MNLDHVLEDSRYIPTVNQDRVLEDSRHIPTVNQDRVLEDSRHTNCESRSCAGGQ